MARRKTIELGNLVFTRRDRAGLEIYIALACVATGALLGLVFGPPWELF